MLSDMKPVRTVKYIANMRMPTEKAHGIQIMKTCDALARTGASLELLVPRRRTHIEEDPFMYYNVGRNFKITYLPTLDWVSMGRLGFLIESVSFGVAAAYYVATRPHDIVYSRDELPLWIIRFITKKVVWESHTGSINFFARAFLKPRHKIVVISRGLRDFYKKIKDVSEMCIAPDGIDLTAFENPQSIEISRIRLGLPLDKKIVMYIGRLDGWKGVSTLLEASLHLPSSISVVIIGGEHPQVEHLQKKYPNVIFLGYRPYTELRDNQAAADVLVLPNTAKDEVSVHFTSPMKLFSYMASGKPIVASDLPSIREVLDESNATFFTADDSSSLRNAITYTLSDEKSLERGHKAKQNVAAYTWDVRARSILAFLSE